MMSDARFEVAQQENDESRFYTLSIDHGESPSDAGYAYALLPGADGLRTEEFANSPDIFVICADNCMHAVRDNVTGKVAANVFCPSKLLDLTIKTPCAIIYLRKQNTYEIDVSDPTLTGKSIVIEFENSVSVCGEKVTADGKTVTFDVSEQRGATYHATVTLQN